MPQLTFRARRYLFTGLAACALAALGSTPAMAQTGAPQPQRWPDQQAALIPILNSGDSAVMYWARATCPPNVENRTSCGRFVSSDSAKLLSNAGEVIEQGFAKRTLPGRGKADDVAIPYSEVLSDEEATETERMGFAIPDDEEVGRKLLAVIAPDSIYLKLPPPATYAAGKWQLIPRTPEPLYVVDGVRMSLADAQHAIDLNGVRLSVWMWPESFRSREGQQFWLEYYKYADSPAAKNGVVKITTNKHSG